MKPQFHDLTVKAVDRDTAEAVTITFDVPADLADAYRFRQGQYLTLETEIDGEAVRRSYSICEGVDAGRLRVAVKAVPGGKFSTFANENLRAGDRLRVMTPEGRFTSDLDPEAQRTYVLFAAGSGITPILSIAKTVLALEPKSRVTLFYGNRSSRTIMFREELEDLKNRHLGRLQLFHILSREVQDADLFNGRIDADKVDALSRGLIQVGAVDHFFICGPEPMASDVKAKLEALGADPAAVHVELFGTPGAAPKPPPPAEALEATGDAAEVTVTIDGKSQVFVMPFDGTSILDAAHAKGSELPFSCKGGVCSTCRCRLREGRVDMAVNYALEEYEVKAGFILACQSRPLTDKVVVDFDEA